MKKVLLYLEYIPAMCKGCSHLGTKCDGGCRKAAHVYFGNITDNDPCFKTENYNYH